MMMINIKGITILINVFVSTATIQSSSAFIQLPPLAYCQNFPIIQNEQRASSLLSSFSVGNRELLSNEKKTILYAKKKASKSGSGKMLVKLVKDVPGFGSAGSVHKVAPAFYMNKLNQSAIRVTDEEVAQEKAAEEEIETAANENTLDLKQKIVNDVKKISLARKTGPDGHLFGAVTRKDIIAELCKSLNTQLGKRVKITALNSKDESKKRINRDIKELGDYEAIITLRKDISVKLEISIVPE